MNWGGSVGSSEDLRCLRDIIVKHLPTTRRPVVGADGWDVGLWYANDLYSARNHAAKHLQIRENSFELEELEASIRRVIYLLDQLSYQNRSEFKYAEIRSDGSLGDRTWYIDFHSKFNQALRVASGLCEFNLMNRRPVPYNFNAEAVSVADECRIIWAEEKWHSESQRKTTFWDGEPSEYRCFIDEYSPRHQNFYRPGPLGRFIEDVFEVLGIVNVSGEPVSAASALSALAKFDGQ